MENNQFGGERQEINLQEPFPIPKHLESPVNALPLSQNVLDLSPNVETPLGLPVTLLPPNNYQINTPQYNDAVSPVTPLTTLQHPNPLSPLTTFQDQIVSAPAFQQEISNATTITLEDTNVVEANSQQKPLLLRKSSGLWSWFANSSLLNKFAEKAKSSVDTMITTLDPGMREFIYSGGDVRIFVASSNLKNDSSVIQIRDAFQKAFGRATVSGEHGVATNIAPQSVGFSAALKAAEEKISQVQLEKSHVDQSFRHRAFVAAQDFVVELVPDRWYDITCLVLRDHRFDGDLQVFSQPSAIPPEYVNKMQDSTTPDYPLRWSGFSMTVSEASMTLTGNNNSENWRENVCGVSTNELLGQAAKSLACMYRRALAEQQQWP